MDISNIFGGGVPILGDAMQIINPTDSDGDGGTLDQRLEGAGSLLGFLFGGPAGAAAGSMIGDLAGDLFD